MLTTAQRANALQKARAAEEAAFRLATYPEDAGFSPDEAGALTELNNARCSFAVSHRYALVVQPAMKPDLL